MYYFVRFRELTIIIVFVFFLNMALIYTALMYYERFIIVFFKL